MTTVEPRPALLSCQIAVFFDDHHPSGEILETDSTIITTRIMGSSDPNPAVGSGSSAALPGLSELQSTTVQQVDRARSCVNKSNTLRQAWSSAKETFARALLK